MVKRRLYLTNRTILSMTKPHVIIAISTLGSFIAWVFPDFGYLRKGLIGGYYDISFAGTMYALLWITCVVTSAHVAFFIGERSFRTWKAANRNVSLDSHAPYMMISCIGYIGVGFVVNELISYLGIAGVINAVINSDANALKQALYEEYNVGLASLRYATILSGALAIYHFSTKRFTYFFLNIFNLISLLCVALISSRLAIVCALLTALTLISASRTFRIRKRFILFGMAGSFIILSALNWSRNARFYENFGIDSWLLAGFSEVLAYVGSAFQGFLAAASMRDSLVGYNYMSLPYRIRVSPELMTNSAFLELITVIGTFSTYAVGMFSAAIGALLCAFAYKNRQNYFFLMYGPIVYGFAELWRVYLFGTGLMITLVGIAIAVPLLFVMRPRNVSKAYIDDV